ncbi:hypothetical protein K2D_03680 [Planctomycetes bacterium K2D]|uniref:Uncharacterized protein n=2 Tax=Botrimarina mediterranea TaxID=2528022 RepID=A0A518K370_9BACT|nr:hypothetical protein Spa11_04150 [Botrimarina mediterranea]QDV76786.1 hypothetical protein K2D_03680 [Planctomycetes bacterium K2D]
MLGVMHHPYTDALPDRISQAAPWWIGIGITGVAITLSSGSGPLLASFALIGIGSDADIARRLREAIAAQGDDLPRGMNPSIVAGFVRRFHAAMYLLLISVAWAAMLHLSGQSSDPDTARWWLASDLAAATVLGFGYSRLARR